MQGKAASTTSLRELGAYALTSITSCCTAGILPALAHHSCQNRQSLQDGLKAFVKAAEAPVYLTALLTARCPAQHLSDETWLETGMTEETSLPRAEGLQQELMTPAEMHHQLLW